MASHTTNNIAVSYLYDADGLRTSKTVNGTKHDYYYLDGKLVYEKFGVHDILYYYDSYGTFAGLQYFPYGNNGIMYYAATNMQGDVIGLYDASGNLVVSYEYDAWGKLLSVTDTSSNAIGTTNPFRYRGYYYDIETGLYYLQSRYYDPETCRFINADGYVSTGQGVFGHNPYLYCANNPANRVDEAGTCYYNANGEWRHDNWEYLGGYVRKPDPRSVPTIYDLTYVSTMEGLNYVLTYTISATKQYDKWISVGEPSVELSETSEKFISDSILEIVGEIISLDIVLPEYSVETTDYVIKWDSEYVYMTATSKVITSYEVFGVVTFGLFEDTIITTKKWRANNE